MPGKLKEFKSIRGSATDHCELMVRARTLDAASGSGRRPGCVLIRPSSDGNRALEEHGFTIEEAGCREALLDVHCVEPDVHSLD